MYKKIFIFFIGVSFILIGLSDTINRVQRQSDERIERSARIDRSKKETKESFNSARSVRNLNNIRESKNQNNKPVEISENKKTVQRTRSAVSTPQETPEEDQNIKKINTRVNKSEIERSARIDRSKKETKESFNSARSVRNLNNIRESKNQNNKPVEISENKKTVQRTRSAVSTTKPLQQNIIEENALNTSVSLNDEKSCQQEVNECLDQFCAVLDDNKKRCMCSESLPRYMEIEKAVKSANSKLSSTVQKIRYVGFSEDEVKSIMSETEAESVLSSTSDTTESRNMLGEIERMIKNSDKVAKNDKGILDLDFNFDEDLSLDFLEDKKSGFANLRGIELFNTAKKRCDSVIKRCGKQDSEQIIMNYEVLIHKDCKVYEKALNKMNDTLTKNIRNANQLLQKARLTAVENKNQFDLKGCVGELNKCMTDNVICGENYEKCLDPTKRFIDENGKIILGSDLSKVRNFMSGYDNSNINKTFIETYHSKNYKEESGNWIIDGDSSSEKQANKGKYITKYLIDKIGTGDKAKDNGLCRHVLDKCQKNTYTDDGKYNKYNEVVVNYIKYALTSIRAQQEKIISEYASKCTMELDNCYNKQVSKIKEQSRDYIISDEILISIMQGACKNIATTCASTIFDKDYCTGKDCTDKLTYRYMKPAKGCSVFGAAKDDISCKTIDKDNCVSIGCSCIPGYISYKGKCLSKDDIKTIIDSNKKCEEKCKNPKYDPKKPEVPDNPKEIECKYKGENILYISGNKAHIYSNKIKKVVDINECLK